MYRPRAQDLCEGWCDCSGLPVPNKPYSFCGGEVPWKKMYRPKMTVSTESFFSFFQHEMDSNNKRTDLQWTPFLPATDGICIHFNFCLSVECWKHQSSVTRTSLWACLPQTALCKPWGLKWMPFDSIFNTPKYSNSLSLCSPWREAGTVFVFLFCTIIKISLYNTFLNFFVYILSC